MTTSNVKVTDASGQHDTVVLTETKNGNIMLINSGRTYVVPSNPVPINPVTGLLWPYSGNTGYKNAPGFNTSDNPTPGQLTPFAGNSANIPPGTYKYILFNPGPGQGCGAFQSGAYSFTGCWFQGNNSSGAILNVGGTSFSADWCSITPIPSLVAQSAGPTSGGTTPPGGGGYTSWPSANVARLTNGNFWPDQTTFDANTLNQNFSSQYGVNINTTGPCSFNHIDMWGMGNGIEIANASATPWTWTNSWIHDNRSDYLGTPPFQNNDHTDGIGMFTDAHYVAINFSNNTIASFGNTNALSNQFTKLGPNSVVGYTQVGNYLSGYNYNIGWSDPGQSFTNATITDNVYATDVPGGFGPSNQDISGSFGNGSGNLWRRNTFRIATRNPVLIASRWDNWQFQTSWNGQYIYPDSSVNNVTHATDWSFGGNVLPPGAVLQDIDGGSNFYASRGLTTAVGLGFDNPNFIQMAPDATGLESAANNESTTIATLLDLNLTAMTRIQGGGNTDVSLLPSAAAVGIYGLPQPTFNGASPYADIAQPNSNTPGFQQDEPNALSDILAWQQNIPNAVGDTRIYAVNFNWITALSFSGTWDGVNNMKDVFPGGTQNTVTTPNGSTRQILDQVSLDQYWFQVATGNAFGQSTQQGFGSSMYADEPAGSTPGFVPGWFTGTSNLPPDVIGRAARYGDVIDGIRQWATGNLAQPPGQPFKYGRPRNTSPQAPIPIFSFIEASYAFTQSAFQNTNSITPPQLNAAVWMSFIHGARGVYYFTHATWTDSTGVDNVLNFASWKNTPLPGQTVTNYAQMKATNLLVKQLAPVLNAKTLLNVVTVSPVASVWAGFDVMAKWYQGGNVSNVGLNLVNGAYVFAAYRGSQLDTNISATFTTTDPTVSVATVVGEGRTIPIVGGHWTDTFANGNSIHIYQLS